MDKRTAAAMHAPPRMSRNNGKDKKVSPVSHRALYPRMIIFLARVVEEPSAVSIALPVLYVKHYIIWTLCM